MPSGLAVPKTARKQFIGYRAECEIGFVDAGFSLESYPSLRFAIPPAFAMSIWPACFSRNAAMTRPMSFAACAPVAAIAAATA
jgi:hypothetical protein